MTNTIDHITLPPLPEKKVRKSRADLLAEAARAAIAKDVILDDEITRQALQNPHTD